MDKTAFYDLTYGMFVLGTLQGEKPTGCTVNTVLQVANEPATLSVSVNHQNLTNACIKKTGRVTVSVLDQDVPMDVIGTFGFQSGREVDKFAQVPHTAAPSGLPRLTEHVCAWFDCKVKTSIELSTHTLFILEVEDAGRAAAPAEPMTYAYYHQVKKGTAPKTAPHFVEEAPASAGDRYVCTICRYEYDGSQGPFEDLPDDWKCPICGMPKSKCEKK